MFSASPGLNSSGGAPRFSLPALIVLSKRKLFQVNNQDALTGVQLVCPSDEGPQRRRPYEEEIDERSGELWRVSTVEGVFEADLDTLKQWIVEGCVLPTTRSAREPSTGSSRRAPMLRRSF